jgi:ATP-binding protein involved in chromosome partitioning
MSNLNSIRYIVGVAAGKGGVGKSTLTVHLANRMAKKGYKVGILDADLYGPSIRKMLPEDTLPSQSPQEKERIYPAIAKGLKVISMAYFREEGEAMVVRAPIANAVIGQFLEKVEWGELDYLFIDFPPGTGDIQLTLLQQGILSGAVIVTTPQEVALLDVRKAIEMFNASQVPLIGVVENMSYFEEPISLHRYYPLGKEGGKRLSLEYGIPFLGEVPLDKELSASGDKGESVYEGSPQTLAAKALESIADEMESQLLSLISQEGLYLKNFEVAWET